MPDDNCPYYKFMFWDLLAGGGGDENCLVQREVADEYGNTDYAHCNSSNYKECPRYLNKMKIESIIEKEREEIVNSVGFGD
jgi:hypothetical protein